MSIFYKILIFVATMTLIAKGDVRFVQLAGDTRLPLPENWIAPTDTSHYPFRIGHQSLSAELLLFRSDIKPKELITSDKNLEKAVQSIVDEVILTLPGAKLLTSTGFYEGARCGFVLEFLSDDSLAETTLRHRLEGIIYRKPEGGQFLFTLWGKSAENQFGLISSDIDFMQKQFRFFGEQSEDVYSEHNRFQWPVYSGLAIALAILLALKLIPKSQSRVKPVGNNQLWRCACGEPNPTDMGTCSSCSAKRTENTLR